jgi:hypothetical protein
MASNELQLYVPIYARPDISNVLGVRPDVLSSPQYQIQGPTNTQPSVLLQN